MRKLLLILFVLGLIAVGYFLFSYVYNTVQSTLFLEVNNSIISMIFGGIVTAFLLTQQSSSEEKKERNIEIYKMKSELYNEFFELVWNVWEDEQLDYQEVTQILKLLKRISMFLDDKSTYNLSKLVNKLISMTISESADKVEKTEKIFSKITTILRNDLGIKTRNIKSNRHQEIIKIDKKNLNIAKELHSKMQKKLNN